MANATGEGKPPPPSVALDRRLKLELHGGRITSDGGVRAYRGLQNALDLTISGLSALAQGRCRLARHEDVSAAARIARDPVMRAVVGREGLDRPAASTSRIGRSETEWLATEAVPRSPAWPAATSSPGVSSYLQPFSPFVIAGYG